jgi:hypothetical protein
MFRKLVDVLKEVFWIKPSRKKAKLTRRKKAVKTPVKKSPVKKKIAKKVAKTSAKTVVKPKLPAAKKPAQLVVKAIDPALVQVGIITHYFDRIKVCVVKLTQGTVLIGDKLTILGDKTKFVQKLWSMQIESEDVKVAKKGQLIGIKVDKMVVVGDKVYK